MKPSLFIFLPAIAVALFLSSSVAKENENPRLSSPKTEGLLNKLLAPGPLIIGHAKLEGSDCLKCHTPRKGIPNENCLECHKEIRASLERKTGFHFKAAKSCAACHLDHKGREFDSTVVDPKQFDHKTTGYILEGKHAKVKCADCHLEKRGSAGKALRKDDIRYFGLKTSCVNCHRKHDPHYFTGATAAKDCDSCHGLKTWKTELKFDHAKDGRFALEGKHRELKCAKCHLPKPGQPVYAWKDLGVRKCLSCHEDPHQHRLSPRFQTGECTTCHSQATWKIARFNHSVTTYPLKGKHADLRCVQCHKQVPAVAKQPMKNYQWAGLKTQCISCHRDPHQFSTFRSERQPRPGDCVSCHTDSRWKEIRGFDHNRDTRLKLTGKHANLACVKCHVPRKGVVPPARVYEWPELATKSCESCHKSPHTAVFSPQAAGKACTQCHVDQGWKIFNRAANAFDHDRDTRFKLLGKHRPLECAQCHKKGKTQVFRFASAEKGFCGDCHQNVHVGQFSPEWSDKSCAACHGQESWIQRPEFKHDATRFRLTGKHLSLDCAKCHVATQEPLRSPDVKAPRFKSRFLFPAAADREFCVGCHKNVHLGQFSAKGSDRACSSCHTTVDFEKRPAFNHDWTSLPLRGKHATVACVKCHPLTTEFFALKTPKAKSKFLYPEMAARDCATCHKDPHQGSFGAKCSDCHNDQAWKKSRDFHKNFTLSGVHYSLDCAECHKNGRRLGGMSENCLLCHQKDDVHGGSLPRCGDCHRQQFWENAEFKHSLTGFPLRGVHRTLDCSACHRNGRYQGTPDRCVDCHLSDALAVSFPAHSPSLIQRDCSECHRNQFSFSTSSALATP